MVWLQDKQDKPMAFIVKRQATMASAEALPKTREPHLGMAVDTLDQGLPLGRRDDDEGILEL